MGGTSPENKNPKAYLQVIIVTVIFKLAWPSTADPNSHTKEN
jgi:hypothetical protein